MRVRPLSGCVGMQQDSEEKKENPEEENEMQQDSEDKKENPGEEKDMQQGSEDKKENPEDQKEDGLSQGEAAGEEGEEGREED